MTKCYPNIINESEFILNNSVLLNTINIICKEECKTEECEINLLICNDEDMQRYNRIYRGHNSITDVLSFTSDNDLQNTQESNSNRLLCDIIVDINQIDRQKGSSTLDKELMDIVIHGLLHTFGYDHIRLEDAKLMTDREIYYKNNMDGE